MHDLAHLEDEEPGLAISPAFWLGCVLSIAAWSALYLGLLAAFT